MNVRVVYENNAQAEYVLRGKSPDQQVLIIEEGPGLTAVIRWDFASATPCYRLAGYAVRVFDSERELIG